MNKFNWDALKFSISKISDKRGDLYFFEALKKTLTFNFNRIYFVKNNFSSYDRGFHAHHRTQQAGLVIQGSCDIFMENSKKESKTFSLSDPSKGILIPPLIWHEIRNISQDAIILFVANEYYDESDYIRDYNEFLSMGQDI